ncbi:uncharacterized protein LOC125493253 [Beta vulgaris subsp. vulgaris]|uniref:uncharacterized protein LOC125493253 n=1 Tax=Beta vulgaris subsp. vulgaris TaxID=3555 RepID=UPI002036C4C6|nr:uncharacterized protein LOC125493253 [Beta vulgaris subsp. vulgaris]
MSSIWWQFLSWSSEDDDKESGCSLSQEVSNQDKANFEAARTRLSDWIASIQTPVRQSGPSKVNPSPHPMQQLNSNVGNVWSSSLFGHLHKEGLDLTINTDKCADNDDVLKITSEDVDPEITYWQSAIVCYILGVKPPFRIIEGFIRRVWGKYGVAKVAMMNNGVFVVRFKTVEDKMKAMQGGPILYDRKPVIMQEWTPDLDLLNADIKVVPTWIKLPGLPLKYWGQSTLHKLASKVGKAIRTDRATAQKDILEYARILVEVNIGQEFPKEIVFENEKGVLMTQIVQYECLPIFCDDCKGIGHTAEACRQKRFELAKKKIQPMQKWVPKNTGVIGKPAVTDTVNKTRNLDSIAEDVDEEVNIITVTEVDKGESTAMAVENNQAKKSGQKSEDNAGVEQGDRGEPSGMKIGDIQCLFGLLETRVRSQNFAKVFARFGGMWSIATNYQCHKGGRIWLLWLPSKFVVNIIECTSQFIHCDVLQLNSGKKWFVTMVYGLNDSKDRKQLWEGLKKLSKNVNEAWVVGGDFNNVLHLNERIGSAITLEEVMEFQQCLRTCSLQEQTNTGPFYTWSNKQEGDDRVFSRIDRIVVNDRWMEVFPDSVSMFFPESISDHCPCLVKLLSTSHNKPKPFRFFNMWTQSDRFISKVQEVWQEDVSGVPMFRIVRKLKKLKKSLKELNRDKFADIEKQADEAYTKLLQAQQQVHEDPLNKQLYVLEEGARKEYLALNKARLSFLQQKVKQEWIKNGDANTGYFHACIKQRRCQNKVCRIKNSDGEWKETGEEIDEAFLEFYKKLLGTEKSAIKHVSSSVIQEGNVVTENQQESLCAPFTGEDVKAAFFDIEDNKAPGPDGYTSCFFKKAWPCIGEDIINAVLNFFQTGKLLKQLNTITLCLIPKVEQPIDVSQFRPIACCNVMYKAISKMLCSRLKVVLPSLVDQVQSAFVANRVIMHNIFICQDMLKNYKRKSAPARCTLKVDLKKAYDSLNWEFIRELLIGLNFPERFIHWIMECLTTPSYSLSVNGGLNGFFQGKRGIRQGDPISPLIFVLAMEYFTRLMKKMSHRVEFKFHHRCEQLKIHHLIFADDLMLFSKGDIQSVVLLVRTLKAFAESSGLEASPEKTAIYFGNVKEVDQNRILQITGYRKGIFPFRYLGVPITSKRLNKADCDILVDRMLKRIMCWSSRHLSYAARTTLVNAVLMSIHTYWAQNFLLPKCVLLRINQVCRAFLWEGKVVLNKAPPVAWDWVCKGKKKGGLGVQDCMKWNIAAIGKFVWQIAQKQDLLWIKWVHCVYLKEIDWWEYQISPNASWIWRCICKVKEVFKEAYSTNNWLTGQHPYTVKEGYQWLQGSQEDVPWHYWVWNSSNIPKHSFIAWLVSLGKLKTRVILAKAGICQDTSCLLCCTGEDSCQHLFFQCPYSVIISQKVMGWIVYHIWRARNYALWNDAVLLPDDLARNIQLDVCGRYKSLIDIKWNDEDKCAVLLWLWL